MGGGGVACAARGFWVTWGQKEDSKEKEPPLTSMSKSLPPRSNCSNLTRNESELQVRGSEQLARLEAPEPRSVKEAPRKQRGRDPAARGGPANTHVGRDFSKLSRSSKVTRLAKLKRRKRAAQIGMQGGSQRRSISPGSSAGENSLANVSREAGEGDVVQGQVDQTAQLREALGESAGEKRNGGRPRLSARAQAAWLTGQALRCQILRKDTSLLEPLPPLLLLLLLPPRGYHFTWCQEWAECGAGRVPRRQGHKWPRPAVMTGAPAEFVAQAQKLHWATRGQQGWLPRECAGSQQVLPTPISTIPGQGIPTEVGNLQGFAELDAFRDVWNV